MKPWFGLVRVSVLSLSHCTRESPGWVLSYHCATLCSAYCQSPDSYKKKWNSLVGHNPSQNILNYKHFHNSKYRQSHLKIWRKLNSFQCSMQNFWSVVSVSGTTSFSNPDLSMSILIQNTVHSYYMYLMQYIYKIGLGFKGFKVI